MIFKKYDFLLLIIFIFFTITGFGINYSRYFCLIGFVPLISYLILLSKEKKFKQRQNKIFLLLFLSLIFSTLIDSTWVRHYNFKLMFFIGLLWGLYYFIFSIFTFILLKKLYKNKIKNIYLISLLISTIYLIMFIIVHKIISFTFFLNWIFALYDLGFLINIFGINWLMFFLIFYQSLISFIVIKKSKKKIIPFLLGIILFLIFSGAILFNNLNINFEESGLVVVMFQGNDYKGWIYNERNSNETFDYFYNATKKSMSVNPDIIMWPEYSVPYPVIHDKKMMDKLYNLSNSSNTLILLGAKDISDNIDFKNYNNINGSYYDAVIIIYPNKTFDKHYQSRLPPLNENRIPQKQFPKIINFRNKTFGIMICWDSHDINYGKKYKNKVDYMLYFDSNSEFNTDLRAYTIISYMHKLQSSYIGAKGIRMTSTGITNIVNENAIELVKVEPFKPEILVAYI